MTWSADTLVHVVKDPHTRSSGVGTDNKRRESQRRGSARRDERSVYSDLELVVVGMEHPGLLEEELVWLFRIPPN